MVSTDETTVNGFHLLSLCQIIPLFRVLPLNPEGEGALKGIISSDYVIPQLCELKYKEWMRKWAAGGTSPLPCRTFVLPSQHLCVHLHQYSRLLLIIPVVMFWIVIVQK